MTDVDRQALLELLKASLFGAEPSFPDGVDWDAVRQEAQAQTVIALAAPFVPAEEQPKWQERVQQNTAHFMRVLYEQSELVKLLTAHDFSFIILKGSAAAVYYPVPSRRTMGDIDFLVQPERYEEARILLEENGYRFISDHDSDRDYEYYKGGVSIEIHRRYSDRDWDFEDVVLDGMARPRTRELCGRRFPSLDDAVNGLVLLDHVRHHLRGGLGIRQIIDWMMFVHSVLDDAFWEQSFAPLARQTGLDRLAIVMTQMCRLKLGLPDRITWCDGADDATALELFEYVMNLGNFGCKVPDVYRPMEWVSMEYQELGLFRFLQSNGLATWKAAKKYAFLRPFAWLYQIFRFIGKGFSALLHGTKLRKDLSDGSQKADFNERLGIVRNKN